MKLKEIGIAVLETTSAGSIASVASSLFTPTSDGRPAVIRRTKKKKDKNPSVYEGDMKTDRKAGIKWVDNPDWKRLHEMDFKMVKDFLDHKESVSEQPAIKAADPTSKFNLMKRDISVGQQSGSTTSAALTTRAFSQIADGKPLPPNLIKAIKPYTDAVQKIMVDPKLFARFRALVKLSNAGSAGTAVGRKLGPKALTAGLGEAVGDSAEPLYNLQDELGLEDNILVDELARYLDVDQIADFVAHFRRHNEMGEGITESLTRQHFQMFANVLRDIEDRNKREDHGEFLIRVFKQDNEKFDVQRFLKAADLVTEKAPPGREKQVKALKGKVDNPYAVSWASYNKSKGKK